MPCGKHSSPRRAPQTVSAESSMEPLETDSLSEKQHQEDVPHCHGSTGQGSGTELHPRTQRTEFWPSLGVLILSPLFYRHSQVLSALPQCLKSRELVPSPNPRVTAQCYFPVTGTGTATFPPAPNPVTYSSRWSPGWETHRSLEWKHRREAQCRAFPRTAHSLQRTQTMHINPIPALFPASKPTTILPAQLGMRQKQAPLPAPQNRHHGVQQGLISTQPNRRT